MKKEEKKGEKKKKEEKPGTSCLLAKIRIGMPASSSSGRIE
jgi:hypothetical protein